MANMSLNFPDINLAFDNSTSMIEVCNKYIDILKETNSITNIQYANKLLEFIDAYEQILYLEEEFHEFKFFLREWSKKYNVKLIMKTRRKNFISLNAKIRLFLSQNRDLSFIRDLLGFKLILCHSENEKIPKNLCYKLVNDTLFFFASKRQCTLLDTDKAVNLSSPNDLVPELKSKVKDYYFNHREDKYKALHFYIRSRSGLTFEIQVSDLDDFLDSEKTHQRHKEERYSNTKIELDYSKIQLPDVKFDSSGNLICDYAGLLESINIFDNI